MAGPKVFVVSFVASLATIWIVWPDRYQRWVDGLFVGWGPAALAAKARVRNVFPFSMTTKPWYPTYLRVIGICIWIVLFATAYLFYRS